MRRSRKFFQGGKWGGGGGGGGLWLRHDGQKTIWTTLFVLVLNLIYSLQRGSNGFYNYRETMLFQGSRGSPTFSRGVQMLISIETHMTCDFPGGGGGSDPLSPPLDPHMLF